MQSVNPRLTVFALVVITGLLSLPGCATKKFVRQEVKSQVAEAVTRLDATDKQLGQDITELKERTDAVDRKATQGINDARTASAAATAASNAASVADTKATNAQTAASAADTKAGNAQTAASAAQGAANAADGKATTAQTAANNAQAGVTQNTTRIVALENRVINVDTLDSYSPSGPTRTVNFAFDSDVLNAEAKRTLDTLAGEVNGLAAGFMIEIQGFTDSTGSEGYNIGLSQRRAQSVERYLVSKGVPLFRTAIVGLGEDNPVADNKSSDGQARNRRVELRLLRASPNPVRR
ncbi:MAG TPA: OmpA family protein [Terriglobia bacterium]|nr:OmpA family protein [Terriglobia bacterium]